MPVKIIRYSEELNDCDGLIIPGGESTTISKLLHKNGLFDKLVNYDGAIFGTCAGAVLLAEKTDSSELSTLKKAPIEIIRNAYGRQVDSFKQKLNLSFDSKSFPAVFIRAPKIISCDNDVEVLSRFNGEPVLVTYEKLLIATFHPELTDDTRIHRYFLEKIVRN